MHLHPAKMAEWIKAPIPSGVDSYGPKKHVLDEGPKLPQRGERRTGFDIANAKLL